MIPSHLASSYGVKMDGTNYAGYKCPYDGIYMINCNWRHSDGATTKEW